MTHCYCLEIFRKKFGNEVQGKCLELACARYRRENEIIVKENEGKWIIGEVNQERV